MAEDDGIIDKFNKVKFVNFDCEYQKISFKISVKSNIDRKKLLPQIEKFVKWGKYFKWSIKNFNTSCSDVLSSSLSFLS